MRKFFILTSLLVSFSVFAQDQLLEPAWKTRIRNLITKVAGPQWGDQILGVAPKPAPEIALPEIPKIVKKNTDVSSYSRLKKGFTDYDRLPAGRKREFDYKFIQELYLVTRKTEAKDEDLSNWLNTLDQGGSREGIYQALVLDEVYAALENIEESPSKKLTDFSLGFSQTFLNQTFQREALDKFNLYTLKRIMTEKGLDLLEFYETKDLDLMYRWYAALSADLGAEFAPLLKSEVRKDSSMKYHYEWAKQMPVQHIKSEFIVKLHTVMNGLQVLQ